MMNNIQQQRESLPTFEYRQDLIDAIREHNILVIIGETGSGKTTQIPQYIYEGLDVKRIGVTQPRRIAAITVAKRVSEEMNVKLGTTVGYTIRFDNCTNESTKLKYMTDGVLLREATLDPLLKQYSCIVIDEAHERTLETDVLLGLLKQTHRLRPDLKILIMSATLQVEKFSDFFDGCPLFAIPGRTFPVQTIYVPEAKKISALQSSFVDLAIDTAWEIHHRYQDSPGDILVFLTGQHDIERACKAIIEKAKKSNQLNKVNVYPLYASMETWDQKAVFAPSPKGKRKIVFATNVAQTSITIPGIRYVVDAGFIKEKSYDATTGMDALLVTQISQAAAIQRAGRAGRTAPGKVYRLYKEECFNSMRLNPIPEIQRSSLLSTVLGLKKRGIIDVLHFPFIDPPDPTMVKTALKHLYLLGAIDEIGQLTTLGDQMSAFPLTPSLSKVLVTSATTYHCSYEVLIIASLLAGEMDLFKQPSLRGKHGQHLDKQEIEQLTIKAEQCKLSFAHHSGDHMTYLNVWNTWRSKRKEIKAQREWCKENYIHSKVLETSVHVRDQLMDVMKKLKLPILYAPTLQLEEKKTKKKTKSTLKGGEKYNDDDDQQQQKRQRKEIDAVPILKSFLTGYFSNVANRAEHRHVFSHYSLDKHLLMDGGIASMEQLHGNEHNSHLSTGSSTELLALHLHPLCSFYNLLDQHKIKYRDINWVMYMHVTYINKAVMKGVSKIVWDWVKEGDGLKRVHRLPKTRLNGEDRPDVEGMELEQENEEELKQAIELQKENELKEKQKRRAEEIEQIRQRALSRRKLQ
ncbi:unnamed protein product [Cunninghamella blakesleeana]